MYFIGENVKNDKFHQINENSITKFFTFYVSIFIVESYTSADLIAYYSHNLIL